MAGDKSHLMSAEESTYLFQAYYLNYLWKLLHTWPQR